MIESLKPCPFCGGEPEIKQYCKNGIMIKCKKCLIQKKQKVLRYNLSWLEEKLIEDWNIRFNQK